MTYPPALTHRMAPTNEPRHRRRAVWIAVLAAVCGLPMMLLTIAFGAGDTSVGNSPGPWVEGYIIVMGIPVAVGVASYVAVRRSGASRRLAVVAAVAVLPAMLIAAAGVFALVVLLS
jgi:hypothetical protein